jgi:hypothetical protein
MFLSKKSHQAFIADLGFKVNTSVVFIRWKIAAILTVAQFSQKNTLVIFHFCR